jgi:hypothetical protein
MARSLHTTTKGVRTHEESTRAVQSQEECANRGQQLEGQQLQQQRQSMASTQHSKPPRSKCDGSIPRKSTIGSGRRLRTRKEPLPTPEGVERGTGTPVGQRKVLKCFNCDKPGHFKRDCRQPLRQNPFYRQNQGPPRTRQADTEEDGLYAARSIVDDRSVIEGRTPQQKAQAWLEGVAEEPDEVKDLVMQQLWRREDFQNA